MALEMSWLRLLEWQLGSTMTAAALAVASFFLFAGWGSWWQGGKATPENAARRWSAAILLAGGVSWLAFPIASGIPGERLAGAGSLGVPVFFVLAGLGSFFLGISFPALAVQVVHSSRERTGCGGVVYAGELLGGLFGVLGGGLVLPLLIGHYMTMHGLCAAAVLVGLAGYGVARKGAASPLTTAEALNVSSDGKKKLTISHTARVRSERGADKWNTDWQAPLWLIPLSGFLVCGWQIVALAAVQFQAGFSLWMTTGVFAGSLTGLAIGAALAAAWARRKQKSPLLLVLWSAGISLTLFPWFMQAALYGLPWFDTLRISPGIAHVLAAAVPSLLCAIAPGMLFPTVWPSKASEDEGQTEGLHARVLGRYLGWNKMASALGSLAFPFLLVPWLGYGGTFLVLALGYGVAALLVARAKGATALWPGLAVLFLIAFLSAPLWSWAQHRSWVAAEHPLEPVWEGEVLAVRSSPYGSIRVVDDVSGSRRIFVGRRYSLNGTNQALNHQRNQAVIPWMLANQPKRVLHLGMGSGITSAAFLQPGVTELHTVEIIPEVAELAREYFKEWNAPLFTDARVKVHCDDGRRVVRMAEEPFDLIVVDLLHPARPSTRLLYTLEFFAAVREKLSDSGLFCLWLPGFQLDDALFKTVAGNFAEVFPEAVLIRGNFSPRQPLLGLVGWKNPPTSLEDTWHSAKLRSPTLVSAPALFFIQPENFLLTFVAPASALSLDQPQALRWDQPWFSLHAAAIGDQPGKLRGGRLVPWMEEILGRWDSANSSSPLARASRAAIRHYDGLLPWTIRTTSEAQQAAKEAHTRNQSGKAQEIYPEALWFTEYD